MTELKITQADRDAAEGAQTFTIMRGEELAYEFARHRIAAEEGKAELVDKAEALLAAFEGKPCRDGWYGEPVHEDEVLALRAALARVRGEG